MELKKGDVVLVQAPKDIKRTEIKKTRLAVVISPKEMAEYGKRALIVPVTSKISKIYPFEFLIESEILQSEIWHHMVTKLFVYYYNI